MNITQHEAESMAASRCRQFDRSTKVNRKKEPVITEHVSVLNETAGEGCGSSPCMDKDVQRAGVCSKRG